MTDVLDDLSTEEVPARRRDRRKPRWGRRILAVVLGLLGLGVALVAAFLLYLNHTVSTNVQQEPLLPSQAKGPVEITEDPAILQSKGLNVLLIGTDNRPAESVGRSDVMVLAHIPEDQSKVFLIHFPRDLWVPIQGRGEAKLNAAYAYGGAPLLVATMQDMLKVRIDHVAKTDFNGFEGMIDAVGGIRVYAEESSSGQGSGFAVQQGWNDMNGERALMFVRERYELKLGDISRGKRQMAMIKALMMKTISPEVLANPIRIAEFTDAATKNLVVDEALTTGFMRDQAFALRNIRSNDVVFITAPYTGFGRSADGQSIDIVDWPGMTALGDAIRNGTLVDYGRVTIIP